MLELVKVSQKEEDGSFTVAVLHHSYEISAFLVSVYGRRKNETFAFHYPTDDLKGIVKASALESATQKLISFT